MINTGFSPGGLHVELKSASSSPLRNHRMYYEVSRLPSDSMARPHFGNNKRSPRTKQKKGSPSALDIHSSMFKSVALECELAFKEARVAAPSDSDDRRPSTDLTKQCCAVLGNLARACGPLRKLLTDIKTELQKAIFSDFYNPVNGATTLCQMPYFEVTARLESEQSEMESQHESLNKKLLAKQKQLQNSASRVRNLTKEIENQRQKYAELERENQELVRKLGRDGEALARAKKEQEDASREYSMLEVAKHESDAKSHHELTALRLKFAEQQEELRKALLALGKSKE